MFVVNVKILTVTANFSNTRQWDSKLLTNTVCDCAFPTCEGYISITNMNTERAFDDMDVELLVGSEPCGLAQERGDLIRKKWCKISTPIALNKYQQIQIV